MAGRLEDENSVVYVSKFREYGVPVLDRGTSYVVIKFCPWCGVRLPPSLRGEWLEALKQRGVSPDSKNIPPEFLSDLWWRTTRSDAAGESGT